MQEANPFSGLAADLEAVQLYMQMAESIYNRREK